MSIIYDALKKTQTKLKLPDDKTRQNNHILKFYIVFIFIKQQIVIDIFSIMISHRINEIQNRFFRLGLKKIDSIKFSIVIPAAGETQTRCRHNHNNKKYGTYFF